MQSIIVYRTSAFTVDAQGGNEAGVVIDASTLSDASMQKAAQAIGYSETAFITKHTEDGLHVRYFTPNEEVALCGHATIALLNLLREKKRLHIGAHAVHTKAGTLKTDLSKTMAMLVFPKPRIDTLHEPLCIATALNLDPATLSGMPIATIDTGVRELYIGLHDETALRTLEINQDTILKLSEKVNVSGIVFYTTARENHLASVRNLLPRIGIEEESATGTAAAALSCLLYEHRAPFKKGVIAQGEALGKPSLIQVAINDNEGVIQSIKISGTFRIIDTLDVPL